MLCPKMGIAAEYWATKGDGAIQKKHQEIFERDRGLAPSEWSLTMTMRGGNLEKVRQ